MPTAKAEEVSVEQRVASMQVENPIGGGPVQSNNDNVNASPAEYKLNPFYLIDKRDKLIRFSVITFLSVYGFSIFFILLLYWISKSEYVTIASMFFALGCIVFTGHFLFSGLHPEHSRMGILKPISDAITAFVAYHREQASKTSTPKKAQPPAKKAIEK